MGIIFTLLKKYVEFAVCVNEIQLNTFPLTLEISVNKAKLGKKARTYITSII